MIKKLRLRFILSALLSVLFVLAATIAAINIANHVKTDREIKRSLNSLVDTLEHNNRLFYGGDSEGQGNSQPGGLGMGFQQPRTEGQYFYYTYTVTSYADRDEPEEPVIFSDYSHLISAATEGAEEMVETVFNGSSNEGTIDSYRYKKVTKVYTYKSSRWGYGEQVDTTTTSTYIAFVDTIEKEYAESNYLINSLIIAAISYSLLAFLIIFSSHFVFKTSEESYHKQKAFVTNASHELKTPLTIISTDLEILEMDNGKNEWTESIRDQVGRLSIMTKQLVTLSKLDENDLNNYPFETFSISKIANESIEAFLPTFEAKKLKFNGDVSENLELKGNKNLINELFYIFMDNAYKYTKDKGEINLTVKQSFNKRIEINFSNDITDKEIDPKQLFERFYRSPNSSKKEGSGIGLSIAKEIIDLHKGKVSASIKDNKIFFNIVL